MMMRVRICTLAFLIALSATVHGQQAAARIDVGQLGPKVGDVVPDFRLRDADGKLWTRDAIMGPKGAMLVFSRSMDWCPYCKTQAIELQSRANDLKARGFGLAIITYDSPAILADFRKRRGITFPLLSDPGSATIKAFGILNTTIAEGTNNYGIPFPGTFLLDRTGKVTSRFFEDAYQERNTVSTIMVALGTSAVPATATQVETDHLRITTYLSDEIVAPGSLFSVVFDIEPVAGVHVYAPGAKDYRVVGFRPDHNPLLVARPIEYPASEIYHFRPLDERVPVYQKAFRLVQPMMVNAAQDVRPALKDLQTLTFDGTIDYQACDDQRCFNPRSLRVSYTLQLRQLDTERAMVPK